MRKHLLDLVVLFLQVLALGTHSTVAFELGPMVSSIIVDTSVIHIGCVCILNWEYIVGLIRCGSWMDSNVYGMVYSGV